MSCPTKKKQIKVNGRVGLICKYLEVYILGLVYIYRGFRAGNERKSFKWPSSSCEANNEARSTNELPRI